MSRTLILAASAFALFAGQAIAQDAPKGDPVRGKKVFFDIGCYQCHGFEGDTGGPGGRLAPNVLPYDAVLGQLRHPASRMPIYTAMVTPDQDVADIYAYLKAQPPSKPVADISLLNH